METEKKLNASAAQNTELTKLDINTTGKTGKSFAGNIGRAIGYSLLIFVGLSLIFGLNKLAIQHQGIGLALIIQGGVSIIAGTLIALRMMMAKKGKEGITSKDVAKTIGIAIGLAASIFIGMSVTFGLHRFAINHHHLGSALMMQAGASTIAGAVIAFRTRMAKKEPQQTENKL